MVSAYQYLDRFIRELILGFKFESCTFLQITDHTYHTSFKIKPNMIDTREQFCILDIELNI